VTRQRLDIERSLNDAFHGLADGLKARKHTKSVCRGSDQRGCPQATDRPPDGGLQANDEQWRANALRDWHSPGRLPLAHWYLWSPIRQRGDTRNSTANAEYREEKL